MLHTGVPVDVWLRQPDGVIETAVRLFNERDTPEDSGDSQMSG